MKCPVCANDYYCPCLSCTPRHEPGKVWIQTGLTEEDWYETCPECGLTMNVHEWFNESGKQYLEKQNAEEKQ